MLKIAVFSAFVLIGTIGYSGVSANARTLNFMNSQGYQTQLAASRKAYADAVAAQQTPQVVHRTTRKKKTAKQ